MNWQLFCWKWKKKLHGYCVDPLNLRECLRKRKTHSHSIEWTEATENDEQYTQIYSDLKSNNRKGVQILNDTYFRVCWNTSTELTIQNGTKFWLVCMFTQSNRIFFRFYHWECWDWKDNWFFFLDSIWNEIQSDQNPSEFANGTTIRVSIPRDDHT